jgi:AcrR family transcriptional regulator
MPTPARTSLPGVVAAARSLIEADGLDALTMQRVAAAVGVRAPSLYKRVRNRGELVRLVIEDAAQELGDALSAAATTRNPRRDLAALADAVRAFAHAHPRAYGLLFAPMPEDSRPEPSALGGAIDPLLRTTAALAGPEHALEAARTVVAWAHGFLVMELAGAFRLGGDVDRAYAYGIERLTVALAAELPTAK